MTRRLSKVFKNKRQREGDAQKYLFTDCVTKTDSSFPWSYPNARHVERVNDDDGNSISTFSTTATVDNNPGPGRLIDNVLYQRLGRKLERGILKFRIYTGGLSPLQIYLFVVDKFPDEYPIFGEVLGERRSVQDIKKFEDGSTTLTGLNSLTHQTR